ncbi:unnamed protein product [Sympodiomycopsis kandeliae]
MSDRTARPSATGHRGCHTRIRSCRTIHTRNPTRGRRQLIARSSQTLIGFFRSCVLPIATLLDPIRTFKDALRRKQRDICSNIRPKIR